MMMSVRKPSLVRAAEVDRLEAVSETDCTNLFQIMDDPVITRKAVPGLVFEVTTKELDKIDDGPFVEGKLTVGRVSHWNVASPLGHDVLDSCIESGTVVVSLRKGDLR